MEHTPPDQNPTNNPQAETWTTDQVATYLKLGSRESARAQLSAWGIKPTGRQPGRSGQNLYPTQPIRDRADGRKGQGYRSDLHNRQDQQ